jgi:hypothetical protein
VISDKASIGKAVFRTLTDNLGVGDSGCSSKLEESVEVNHREVLESFEVVEARRFC